MGGQGWYRGRKMSGKKMTIMDHAELSRVTIRHIPPQGRDRREREERERRDRREEGNNESQKESYISPLPSVSNWKRV